MAVALTSVDVLVSELTGHVIDVRLVDPLTDARLHGQEAGAPVACPAPAATASQPLRPQRLPDRHFLPGRHFSSRRRGDRCPSGPHPELTLPGLGGTDELTGVTNAAKPSVFRGQPSCAPGGHGSLAGFLPAAAGRRLPADGDSRTAARVLALSRGGDRQLPG